MKTISVIVKKKFRDRLTGKTHKPGEKLTISDQRFREIKRSGDYVELETAAKTADKPVELKK